MPAHASNVYDIYFTTVRLIRGIANAYSKFLGQLFFGYLLPKLLCITNVNRDHEIFSKLFVVEFLQDEFAIVSLKTDIVATIPIDLEAEFLE